MKCDVCKREMNYCFYIDDAFWLQAVGKKEGYRCAHCVLETLGEIWGTDYSRFWYIVFNEPQQKSTLNSK